MKLVSENEKGIYSTGYYSFFFNNDNTLRLIYDGPDTSVYWPLSMTGIFKAGRTNFNCSRTAVLDKMGRFSSSDKLEFYASDMSLEIKRRLTIDSDGNLRLYSLDESTRKFSFVKLKKATNKFKEELGRGGSGAVYKGVLKDNRVVAVKKQDDVTQGEEEFWADVSIIGTINHMNLVRMWGVSSDKTRKLLVYEYWENLSLDKHLFSSNVLRWKERQKIVLGASKGLAYLHHECLEWVIHCDVKPENILLDGNFVLKIADFGLAKLSHRGGSGSEFSRIRGTDTWLQNGP
ncbi:hypothetical protein GIB67_007757 [Kingdonia uniflora]|uniref:non-specific serine/threonine protein kinase n=1 Tax=Kingdonia uniflora TaxID=39325 RepID=A0A7J7N1W1_9MAGN|nr:hypothetical protein GIB67_007757 [Kingdonia uniflora]